MSDMVDAVVEPMSPTLSRGGDHGLRSKGLWRDAMRQTLHKPSALIGVILLALLVLMALFAPLLAPYGPREDFLSDGVQRRSEPCWHLLGCDESVQEHILGTDGNGRDYLSRLMYGARISMLSGIGAVTLAVTSGAALGLVAGFYGRWMDSGIMRCMDVLLAFPSLLLAIAIVSVLGPGLTNAMLAIAIVSIPAYARVMRASVLSVKEEEYTVAARTVGVSASQILSRHIIPNAISPLIVQATLGIGTAILETAALSFLGLGAQPPTPEWGSMLSAERNQVFSAPHLVFLPGLAIMINVLGFNLLGDGLRDALDPRLRR